MTNILDNIEGHEAKNLKEDLNLPFNVSKKILIETEPVHTVSQEISFNLELSDHLKILVTLWQLLELL